jgi:hypothetical protein
MRRTTLLVMLLMVLCACSQDSEPDPNIVCKRQQFPSYNAKDMNQCVAACIICEKGVTTTCTTSCTLKGARQARQD